MAGTVGRVAKCTSCKQERPSGSPGLAFFEDRGEGSRAATQQCKTCRYHPCTHEPINPVTGRPGKNQDHPFTPHGPWDTDLYYCGCRGWE